MYSKISDGLSIMKPTDFSPDGESGEMYPNNPNIRALTLESNDMAPVEPYDFKESNPDMRMQDMKVHSQTYADQRGVPMQQAPMHDMRHADQRGVPMQQAPMHDMRHNPHSDPRMQRGYQGTPEHAMYMGYVDNGEYLDDVVSLETPVNLPSALKKRPDDRKDFKSLKGDRPSVRFDGIPTLHKGGIQSDVAGGSLAEKPTQQFQAIKDFHPKLPRQTHEDDDIEFLVGDSKHHLLRPAPPPLRLDPPQGLTIEKGLPMCWAFCRRCRKKERLRSCDCFLSTNFICEGCGWTYLAHENDNCKVMFWRRVSAN
jgi:hypothetical protein